MTFSEAEFKKFIEQAHDMGSQATLLVLRGVIDGLLEKLDGNEGDE